VFRVPPIWGLFGLQFRKPEFVQRDVCKVEKMGLAISETGRFPKPHEHNYAGAANMTGDHSWLGQL
jgi:hypothetical protein